MACDKCTQIGAVTLDQRCSFELYQLVSHVSYKYFIATLWTRDLDVACVSHHEPTCTRIYPGRPAAVAPRHPAAMTPSRPTGPRGDEPMQT